MKGEKKQIAVDQKFSEDLFACRDWVYKRIYLLSRNTSDAELLVDDAILKAMQSQDKYQPGTNMKAWLFTIAKNMFINNYRKAKKFKTIDYDTLPSATFTHGGDIPRSLKSEEIRMVLSGLPIKYKKVILQHAKGHKYHEIAAEMSVPEGTVKSILFRARTELARRAAILGYGEECKINRFNI